MLKRRLVQTLSLLLYNADLAKFKTGAVSKSPLKNGCVPGLNCYSCPGALSSCPLGALQNALAEGRPPLLVAGILLLFAVTLGRTVCGFLCPFGLLQELLYKIPSRKLPKSPFTRSLTLVKYALLAVLVTGLPLAVFFARGYGAPFFCEFVCPAGTLEAGVPLVMAVPALRDAAGGLFLWKLCLLVLILVLSVFCFRVFCRFLCPLGAFYGLFNRLAVLGPRIREAACTRCGSCARKCGMDTLRFNDRECVRCGKCLGECPARVTAHVMGRPFFKLFKENI
ncbi:MAG: 4Fe-4S binding protein [Spirochaetaceae bacterium]|nr:4Fe-4S binding protein [Spirochaetaceae bacterium]